LQRGPARFWSALFLSVSEMCDARREREEMEHIETSQFKNRFVSMVLDGQGFPKKPLDRHILFISAMFGLEPGRHYTERELNDVLRSWTERFGDRVKLDHVTLRRYLVDACYLERDTRGESYQVRIHGLPYTWDDDLKAIDLDVLVAEARADRELRKQQHLGKTKD
jgi:hypothetical protein